MRQRPWCGARRSIASDTRRGVSGVSLKRAPMLRNASATAFAIAAGGAIAPPSPRPFTPYSVASAGEHEMREPHVGNLRRARHHVVAERGRERLAELVERDFLVERGADALRNPALHLPVDDHRIDHRAAVFRHRIVEKLDHAAVGIDGNDDSMGAVGEHAAAHRRLIGADRLQQGLHTGRQLLLARVRHERDLADADFAGGAVHRPALDARVGDVGLQKMRADLLDLLDQHPARPRHRAAGKDDRARRERAEPHRDWSPCRRSGWRCDRDRWSARGRRSAPASSRDPGRGSARRHG